MLMTIPGARVQYEDGRILVRMARCGACGREWNDALISGVTPAPSARCPWEHLHVAPAEQAEGRQGLISALASGVGDGALDEVVHEVHAEQASADNNGGAWEQVAFLIEALGPEEARCTVEQARREAT